MIKVRMQRVGAPIAAMNGMAAETVAASGCGEVYVEFPVETNDVQMEKPLFVSSAETFDISEWYAEGGRFLKTDKYDNRGGQPFVNYQFFIHPSRIVWGRAILRTKTIQARTEPSPKAESEAYCGTI